MGFGERLIAWYLGLPPPAPGTTARWTIEFESPLARLLTGPIGWLVLIALLAGSAVLYRRESPAVPRHWLVLLIALRWAAMAWAVLALLGATLRVERTGRPALGVLIDTSASMSFSDRYRPSDLAPSLRSMLGESTRELPRIAIVQRFLAAGDGRLDRWDRRFQLKVYTFAEHVSPAQPERGRGNEAGQATAEAPSPAESGVGASRHAFGSGRWAGWLERLEASGRASRLATAARRMMDDLRGRPVVGLVIFTDGIATPAETEKLSSAAALFREQAIPLFVAGIGTKQSTKDVQLIDVRGEDHAFLGDPILLTVVLRAPGFEGDRIEVVLQRRDDPSVLQRRTVIVPPGGRPVTVELSHTPTTEGTVEYVIRVPPLEGETTVQNNRLSKLVTVRKDKLRVLLADGPPRWSFRTLKALLEREPTVELHTALQEADPEFAAQDATARPIQGRIPSDPQRLFGYHVIVLGDVNLEFVSPSVQRAMTEFVKRGGGLVLIAGRRFNPWTYFDAPIGELLPFDRNDAVQPAPETTEQTEWLPEPTPAGRVGTTLFRFATGDATQSAGPLPLPGFQWVHRIERTRPGVVTLLQARAANSRGAVPVILSMRLGRGRVLYHATEEVWRWRRPARLSAFQKYWLQALRMVGRAGAAGEEWELSTNRQVYRLGETVRIRLKSGDGRTTGSGKTAIIEGPDGRQIPLPLAPVPVAPGVLEGTFRPELPGRYHIRTTGVSGRQGPLTADFRVEASAAEMARRALDEVDLRTAAEISRGRYYSVSQLDSLPAELPSPRPIPLGLVARRPLWNRWEWLLPLAAVLSTEWIIRRRRRLP